jgi:hypothetical protein
MRAIKRLFKLAGFETFPDNGGWLTNKKGAALRETLSKMPVSKARHLYLAGAQAFNIYYKKRDPTWNESMNTASLQYSLERSKQQMSEDEKMRWPSNGYKSLSVAASMLKKQYKDLINAKTTLSASEQYLVQKWLVLYIFSRYAFRLEPASWQIKASDKGNTLLRKRGSRNYVVTHRDHKSVATMGTNEIKLDLTTSRLLGKYLPRIKGRDHDYLLSNKDGTKMNAPALSKLIIRLTTKLLHKKIGVRQARIMKVTSMKDTIGEVERLARQMGHTTSMQKTYIRKKD